MKIIDDKSISLLIYPLLQNGMNQQQKRKYQLKKWRRWLINFQF